MPKPFDESTIKEYSPLILAYIGDAVFELLVRTKIIASNRGRIKDIHLHTVEMVNARHQADIIRQIDDQLTEEEKTIVRRGRNTRSNPPKNADMQAYRMSTGFEALLGYLYLKGDEERLINLVNRALENEL